MKVRFFGLALVVLIMVSSIFAQTQSAILDPPSNLQGDQARTFLDIVESDLILKDDFYTFTVIMSSPFPSILNMKDRRIDIIWFVDIDRNKRTGQSHMGNDYNIHIYLSENGWRSSWYKVTEKSRNDGIQVETKDFRINVKGNRASLSFPKFYLPSNSFDWWVYAGTGNSPNWIPIAENPHTERATFNSDMNIRSPGNFNINDYQEYNYVKSEIFKLTDNPFGIQDVEPAILQTKEGNIWLVWRHEDLQLYYKISNDNGNTWSASHYLTDWGNNLSPSIIQTSDGRIWVVWCGDRNGWYIFYRVTSNDGKNWSPIQKIETSMPHSVHPAVIETMDRKLWIFWGDYVTGNDGGKSWSSIKRPFATLPFNSSLCQTSDGRLWVVGWTGSHAAYSVSDDNGHTWSSKVYIGKASSGAVAPEVVQSSDGKIWITWHSNHGGNEDIYYVVSKDNGTNWSPPYKMTNYVTNDYAPDVAEINNKIWIVWSSDRDGDHEIYSKIIANVETGKGPIHILERSGQIPKERIKQQLDTLLNFSSFNDPIQYLNHIENLKRFFNSNLEILYPGKLLIEEVLKDINDNAGIKNLNAYPKSRNNIVLCISPSYKKKYKIPVPDDNAKPSYFKEDGVLYDFFLVENSYGVIPLDDLRHKGYIEKLNSIRQSKLYNLKKRTPNTYQCKFIRCVKVSNIGLDASRLSNREWQDVLERTREIWIESEILVNKNGIPLEKPGEWVRPIALKTDKNYYLVQENFNSRFDHCHSLSGCSTGVERLSPVIYPFGETMIDENLAKKVISRLLNILKNKFKNDPFNAYVDEEWPDMIIMTREREKSKLLNDKYEITGYLIRISLNFGVGIDLYIRYNVLTANHPDHNFYDPPKREFDNYKKAIQMVKEEVIDTICKEFNFAGCDEWKLKILHDGGER
jgi:hypothetical protein